MIDWIKIEEGCQMPMIGDLCIVIIEREFSGSKLAFKNWDGIHFHNYGIVDKNEGATHWAKIELPDGV